MDNPKPIVLEFDKIKEKLETVGVWNTKVEAEFLALWNYGVKAINHSALRSALIHYLKHVAPVEFFTAPASSSGKYHPTWQNEQCGILRNTTECCLLIEKMMRAFPALSGPPPKCEPSPFSQDIIIAATILSDSQKCGKPWGQKMDPRHGIIAAEDWRRVAKNFALILELREGVAMATHWHMGRWTPEWTPDVKFSPETWLTHLLDMFFAQKELELLYTPKEKIE